VDLNNSVVRVGKRARPLTQHDQIFLKNLKKIHQLSLIKVSSICSLQKRLFGTDLTLTQALKKWNLQVSTIDTARLIFLKRTKLAALEIPTTSLLIKVSRDCQQLNFKISLFKAKNWRLRKLH
jgi:hypothetical protein